MPTEAKTAARPRHRIKISDVADALGMTKGTVSRALNGYPDIAESTRLKVHRKAEAMGYRPLAQAQGMRTGRTRTLGLVLQTDIPGAERPFLSDFLAGITQAASAENWTLTVATSAGGAAMEQTLERLVHERKSDGFILPRTRVRDGRAELLKRLEVPFVLFGRVADDSGCAWFDILGEEAMAEAVERLRVLGHRRIGFVGGAPEYNFAPLREAGFRRGLEAAGLPLDEALILRGAMLREEGARATRRLLSLEAPPTAIVFAVDLAALGAYDAARDRGLAIGRDLSVISYDGIPEGSWAQPSLTTFGVDSHLAGERLAGLLIRRIRGEAPEELRETAKARLLAGGSDGPPNLTSEDLAARISAALHDPSRPQEGE
ncbi:MAG: LacI family transcriptional regulator [Silicimonas sp.]|nr:LacI family transcriptional regulator [Silicimonas sp.]